MDKSSETIESQPTSASEAEEATARRAFILKLAKAAIVPAVVAGIAASASTAHAGYT